MITHIHSAGIPVRDQDAAIDFYVNKLGWEVRIDQMADETMRFVTVAPKGAQTELALMKADADAPSNPGISMIADDIQATYDELTARGVEFTMPVTEMPWGDKGAEFVDEDGNKFYLNESA